MSVVVPALNEAANLPVVLGALPPDLHEVILVDGHSTDGTPEVARRVRPDVRIVQQTRRGKGNALACGFAAATGDVVVTFDADGSADPAEIPRFVEALVDSRADYAKGSRFAQGGGSSDITRLRRLGNSLLSRIANRALETRFSDLCYGFNAFWLRCLPAFALDVAPADDGGAVLRWGDGFEIETLLNLRAVRAGLTVVEVPSFERPRLHGRSNLNAVQDGLRVLRTILAESRRAAAVPAPVAPVVDLVARAREIAELEIAQAAAGLPG